MIPHIPGINSHSATPPVAPQSQNALASSQSGKLGPLGQEEAPAYPPARAPLLDPDPHVDGEEREGENIFKSNEKIHIHYLIPSAIQPIRILNFSLQPLLLLSRLLISCLSFINNSAHYTLLNSNLDSRPVHLSLL